MKKVLFILSSLVMVSAQANQTFCGYKDYFHLSDATHPGVYIYSSYSESDVFLELVGPRSFVIKDMEQCRSGYAHVTVAYDNNNWCVLNIKDGPYMNHPSIQASCNGMRYLGISYDGFRSYSYTIDLD
jgi:hypothetical protein